MLLERYKITPWADHPIGVSVPADISWSDQVMLIRIIREVAGIDLRSAHNIGTQKWFALKVPKAEMHKIRGMLLDCGVTVTE